MYLKPHNAATRFLQKLGDVRATIVDEQLIVLSTDHEFIRVTGFNLNVF